jgi:biotin transport system substrate-specific component
MSTRRNPGTDLALIAAFAALVAVCALLPAIKVAGPVPITLQTFAVLLSGAVLGMRRGFLAVLLYVVAIFCAGLFSSAVCIHTLGMAGLVLRADLTWAQAWDIDKIFWLGDVLKNIAMALVATAVHRAFPDLLGRPATAATADEGQPEGTPTA